MCGLAGIVWTRSAEEKRPVIQRMTDTIAHRGPDAEGHHVDEHVALGHRRLSIIDLSEEANQPMWDVSGRYAMVFNGEVYNFESIKERLTNYPFRTSSDTEVVLAAYIKWGESFLQELNGMFALAIWDVEKQRLFAARDRLGIKPFYFHQSAGRLFFASEIRAILASGLVEKKLNRQSVHEFLTYQTVHAPNTMVEGISQLHPGEYCIFENGVFLKKTYWKMAPEKFEATAENDYGTIKKNIRQLLLQAVERRLVSDVPLGAFLSGGIDSSAVVALMSQVSDRPAETFSVIFEEKQFDESRYSNLIAKKYKTNHHPLLLHPTDFLDAMPDAIAAMDMPTGDGVNTYTVSKATRKAGITVALSGLGGDELFAGYPLFQRIKKIESWRRLWAVPSSLRGGLAHLASGLLKSHEQARFVEIAGAKNTTVEEIYPAFRKVLTPKDLGFANGNGSRNDAVHLAVEAQQPRLSRMPLLSQVTVADISTYTQNVLLKETDQMSMAHALEVRVPFFDHTLVEYVLTIPDRWKYPGYVKKLLVESLHPLLPDEIVFREKKGFNLPWKVWLKNELRQFCEVRLHRFSERGLIDRQVTERLWADFVSGKNDNLWSRVWVFVVLEDWLERNIDN